MLRPEDYRIPELPATPDGKGPKAIASPALPDPLPSPAPLGPTLLEVAEAGLGIRKPPARHVVADARRRQEGHQGDFYKQHGTLIPFPGVLDYDNDRDDGNEISDEHDLYDDGDYMQDDEGDEEDDEDDDVDVYVDPNNIVDTDDVRNELREEKKKKQYKNKVDAKLHVPTPLAALKEAKGEAAGAAKAKVEAGNGGIHQPKQDARKPEALVPPKPKAAMGKAGSIKERYIGLPATLLKYWRVNKYGPRGEYGSFDDSHDGGDDSGHDEMDDDRADDNAGDGRKQRAAKAQTNTATTTGVSAAGVEPRGLLYATERQELWRVRIVKTLPKSPASSSRTKEAKKSTSTSGDKKETKESKAEQHTNSALVIKASEPGSGDDVAVGSRMTSTGSSGDAKERKQDTKEHDEYIGHPFVKCARPQTTVVLGADDDMTPHPTLSPDTLDEYHVQFVACDPNQNYVIKVIDRERSCNLIECSLAREMVEHLRVEKHKKVNADGHVEYCRLSVPRHLTTDVEISATEYVDAMSRAGLMLCFAYGRAPSKPGSKHMITYLIFPSARCDLQKWVGMVGNDISQLARLRQGSGLRAEMTGVLKDSGWFHLKDHVWLPPAKWLSADNQHLLIEARSNAQVQEQVFWAGLKYQSMRGLYQFACGLQTLHERGIVNGDIKPTNCLWLNGRLVIADHEGTSLALQHPWHFPVTEPHPKHGYTRKKLTDFCSWGGLQTPGYNAPERASNSINLSSDIWSYSLCFMKTVVGYNLCTPFMFSDAEVKKMQQIRFNSLQRKYPAKWGAMRLETLPEKQLRDLWNDVPPNLVAMSRYLKENPTYRWAMHQHNSDKQSVVFAEPTAEDYDARPKVLDPAKQGAIYAYDKYHSVKFDAQLRFSMADAKYRSSMVDLINATLRFDFRDRLNAREILEHALWKLEPVLFQVTFVPIVNPSSLSSLAASFPLPLSPSEIEGSTSAVAITLDAAPVVRDDYKHQIGSERSAIACVLGTNKIPPAIPSVPLCSTAASATAKGINLFTRITPQDRKEGLGRLYVEDSVVWPLVSAAQCDRLRQCQEQEDEREEGTKKVESLDIPAATTTTKSVHASTAGAIKEQVALPSTSLSSRKNALSSSETVAKKEKDKGRERERRPFSEWKHLEWHVPQYVLDMTKRMFVYFDMANSDMDAWTTLYIMTILLREAWGNSDAARILMWDEVLQKAPINTITFIGSQIHQSARVFLLQHQFAPLRWGIPFHSLAAL